MRCSFSAASASCFSAWTVKRVSEYLCELHDVSNYYFLLFFRLPQLALLSAGSFSPTPWASSVLSLQPSRSVSRSVSHWRSWGLRLLSGPESFSYLSVCCSSWISRLNLLFPNWAQLNTLLTLRPSACFSFISLKTLCDSHSLQLIIFTFFFVSREFSVEILTSRFVTLSSASHSPLWVLGKVPEL